MAHKGETKKEEGATNCLVLLEEAVVPSQVASIGSQGEAIIIHAPGSEEGRRGFASAGAGGLQGWRFIRLDQSVPFLPFCFVL